MNQIEQKKKRYNRIYIEITNICNLNCSFCPILERDKEVMSLVDFEAIIRQAAPLASQVCLHLMGEPLAHPQFLEILEICKKYDTQVQLTTNGILINKYQDEIVASNTVRQINFSLQSYLDNYPNKDYTPYLDKIEKSIQFFNLESPQMYLNLRLWNLEEQDAKYVEQSNEKIFDFFESRLDISIKRTVDVSNIKSKKIWNKLYLHFDSRFEWPRPELEYQGDQGRCNALKDHIAIHSNGDVSPCCLDDQAVLKLGNCLEKSLDFILQDKRAQDMKNGFENGRLVEDLCQKCSFINRFKKTK